MYNGIYIAIVLFLLKILEEAIKKMQIKRAYIILLVLILIVVI